MQRGTQRIIRLQQHPQRREIRRHDRRRVNVRQHDRQPFAEDAKVGVHAPSGVLLGDDLGAGRHETHAGVVVVREDGLDEVVDEVERADGVAFGVADEHVGGGEVGGEVELLPDVVLLACGRSREMDARGDGFTYMQVTSAGSSDDNKV